MATPNSCSPQTPPAAARRQASPLPHLRKSSAANAGGDWHPPTSPRRPASSASGRPTAKAATSATPPSTPRTARRRGRRQASHQSRKTAACCQRQQPHDANVGCDQQLPAANASSRLLPMPTASMRPAPNNGNPDDNAKRPSPPTLTETATPPRESRPRQKAKRRHPIAPQRPPAANTDANRKPQTVASGKFRRNSARQLARHQTPANAATAGRQSGPQASPSHQAAADRWEN